MCREGRTTRLLQELWVIVAKHEANGSHAHRSAVAERSARKERGGQLFMVALPDDRFEDDSGASAIAAVRLVVGCELLTEMGLVYLIALDKGFGYSDGHLSIVGVGEHVGWRLAN